MTAAVRPSEATTASALGLYLKDIRILPHLYLEQELRLARLWVEQKDCAAGEALITAHLGLVVKIANGFRGYGLPVEDLIAEGNLGMLRAVSRFDPDRGLRLSTYAAWWVRAAILEYILRSWSLVRVCTTPRHKRIFFNLRRVKSRLGSVDDELAPDIVMEIARRLNVPKADVVHMNNRLAGPDYSLNAVRASEDGRDWQEALVDPSACPETSLAAREEIAFRRDQLRRGMVTLNERERHILSARHLGETPVQLKELALHHGVTIERIRQIESRAIHKLQVWSAVQALNASKLPRSLDGAK
jgi:RNA polymerase sigma-32 factor